MAYGQDEKPTVSTKEELLRRLRNRSAPNRAATLEPQGGRGSEVKREIEKENRQRIAVLRNSLETAHSELEVNQTFARLGGFAKARFSNER